MLIARAPSAATASSRRSRCACTSPRALCAGSSSASRARGCTGPTTTAGARTSSGWRAGRRSSRTSARARAALVPELDAHAAGRLREMLERYAATSRALRRPVGRHDERSSRRLAGRSAARYALPDGVPGALARLLELLRPTHGADDRARPGAAVDAHVADSLVALELDAVRAAAGSPTSAPARASPASCSPSRCRRPRVAGRERRRKCAFLARAAEAMGSRTPTSSARGPRSGRRTGARPRDRPRARAAGRARGVRGAAAAVGGGALVAWKGAPRRRGGGRRRRGGRRARAGAAPTCAPVAPSRAPTSAPARLRRRSRRRPTGYPAAGREWPANARSRALQSRAVADASAAEPIAASDRSRRYASASRWAPSTRSRTRRAASARRRPPSTSPRASPRRASRRCSSTSTRRRNATVGPRGSPKDAEPSIYDVLSGDATAAGRRAPTTRSSASRCSRRTPTSPAPTSSCRATPGSETRLRDALAGVRERFAYVLLDCPPSLGPLTVNALVAADRVIVPVQTEYFALEGLAGLLDTLQLDPARAQPAPDGRRDAADDARRPHAPGPRRRARGARALPVAGLRHGHPAQRARRARRRASGAR